MSGIQSLYVDGDTVLHRLNPRPKLVLAVALFVAAYVFDHPVYVSIPLLLALAVLAWTGGLRNLRRIWFVLVALFATGFVIWPSFAPAQGPVVVDGPVTLTEYELLFALGRSERIVAFIVAGFAFITVTSTEELVEGLQGIGVPYAFCFAVATSLRLFPTFLNATGSVRQAQEARGLDLSASGPVERLRRYLPLVVPVIMTAIRQVNAQSKALEARGFDTRRDRTFYGKESFGHADWIAVGVGVASIGGCFWLARIGAGVL